jgi:CheY-like chemotaxis protein
MQPDILIIDDDPAILATVAEILHDEGYSVRVAGNGLEGLVALEQQLPALILLDMRMPVLDGWGFVQALRERGVRVPFVVLTAAQDAHRWAQEVGASEFLAKPFDLEELLAIVEQFMHDSSSHPRGGALI